MNRYAARWRGWLELLRLPNLPTVPGDAVAGFALASAAQSRVDWRLVWPTAVAALLLYAAGLIWNDCADHGADRVARPQRPLPSGRVDPRSAAWVGAILAALGVAIATVAGPRAALAAGVLLTLIVAYDFSPWRAGPGRALTMGACRGMSLLLGAAAAGAVHPVSPAVWIAAAGVTLFIASVTWIAQRETSAVRVGGVRWAPVISVILLFAWLVPQPGLQVRFVSSFGILWSVGVLFYQGRQLRGVPAPATVSQSIGSMIRALIPLQAALCAMGVAGGTTAGILLLVGWPASSWLARRFYAS